MEKRGKEFVILNMYNSVWGMKPAKIIEGILQGEAIHHRRRAFARILCSFFFFENTFH
jgi:hypothetical protein